MKPSILNAVEAPAKKFKLVFPWQRIHLDLTLITLVIILGALGLIILYGATTQSSLMLQKQALRLGIAGIIMILVAQIPPAQLRAWAPWLFIISLSILAAVLEIGHIGKGAQRWLSLGLFRFQPAEMVKLSLPLFLAWYFDDRPLPPTFFQTLFALMVIAVPVLLIAKQPDLGTALMIGFSGACVLLLAGMRWRYISALFISIAVAFPLLWHHLHDYQKQRVLTFINPERDPLGSGYHIIQSKIAIGSGGFFGKGWLTGTQSRLHFLPENATDFIFAVAGEEFGFIGCATILGVCLLITARCLYICAKAPTTFTRLLAGTIGATFFMSVFVNMGMVTGMLPVVGLPLPLISYGGTSMVTLLASFGILMSINTHKQLVTR